jgi:hypothetical protein
LHRAKNKGDPKVAFTVQLVPRLFASLLSSACARVTLLELVDTASGVDDFVLARVEGMRLRRDFDTDNGILFAVCPFHFFFAFGIGSRLGQEFEIARRIKKDDFVVRWVCVGFHDLPFFS